MDYFDEQALREGMRTKAARGGFWTMLSQAVILGGTILATLVLTRLLKDSDFGAATMALATCGFALLLTEAGLSNTTIQQTKLTHQQASNAFWMNIGVGSSLAVMIFVAAPWIAQFYREPIVSELCRGYALAVAMSAWEVQPRALLRRGFRFAKLAMIDVTFFVVRFGGAVVLAYYWRSSHALIVAFTAAMMVRVPLTLWASGWWPSWPRARHGTRQLAVHGARLTGYVMASYFSRNTDYMLIGRRWGAALLGFYERAFSLMMVPAGQVAVPMAVVAIPALSRARDDAPTYRKAYLEALDILFMVVSPLAVLSACCGDWIVLTAYGEAWKPSIPIFVMFSVNVFVEPLINATTWLFSSQERTRDLLNWGLFACPVTILSFLAGLPFGPQGVAAAYAITTSCILMPIVIWWAGRRGPVRSRDIWNAIASLWPVLLSHACFLCLLRLATPGWQPAVLLIVSLLITVPAVLLGLVATAAGRSRFTRLIQLGRMLVQNK